MEIEVLASAEAVAARAAAIVAELLGAKSGAVLGLPAGNTPRPVYAELVRRHRQDGLSFAGASAFSLDEYVGLPLDHPASFRRQLDEGLYRHVDLPTASTHAPDGGAADLDAESARYEEAIARAGGFDLVLLGIGGNGHIAFNEPGSPATSRTRVVALAPQTRAGARAGFADGRVPERAITVGVATILDSRRCLLLACGAAKAEAIARALRAPPTPLCPASALQDHPHATALLDPAAAELLSAILD
jgi:glucosamine-6-phosphate deaminase